MEHLQTTGSTLDSQLDLLAVRERRLVLRYLAREPTGIASLDELADHVVASSSSDPPPDREAIQSRLHHTDLPRLADFGLVEYDPRNRDVRYRSDDQVETLLECIPRG